MWQQLQLTLRTSAICFNMETSKWCSEEPIVAFPLPQGKRLPLVRGDFGEKWNGIMKMDTKIPGSQEPGSGLKYRKSTCCVPLVWQGATLKMAHFTRRQQPCQHCTHHIPSMSICTIKQEAKGFPQSKWGRPIEARPKSSVTITTSLVKKQQIRTFEQCW